MEKTIRIKIMDFFYKCVYKIGERIRNYKISEHTKMLLETDFETIENLEVLQLKRLKKLLIHAKAHSPYYQDSLKNIDIESMSLENLEVLPVLTKQNVQEFNTQIQNRVDEQKHFKSVTSGSTGNPLLFYRNLDWDAAHRATIMRGYSWYNVKPWEKSLYFWGFNPNWKKRILMRTTDFLMNRYRIFSYNDKDFKQIRNYISKVKYIEGYSSAIFTMSQYFSKTNQSFDQIKMVKGTSEKIFDYYQGSVQRVFNQKMISEYGSSEGSVIAYECPSGHMHIAMENVIVEEVDKKILVTNLHSFSFPIIRYELGDYIELDKKTLCACGRKHYIIKEVTGRIGKKIEGKNSSYPSSSLFYMFKNLVSECNVKCSYFACQDTVGILNLKVMCEEKDEENIRGYIEKEKEVLYADDLELNIKFISELSHKNRKVQSFESNLDNRSRTCSS